MRTAAGAHDGRYVLRRARFGGVRSSVFGINGEGKSLETVTKPLTSVVAADDEATSLAVLPAATA